MKLEGESWSIGCIDCHGGRVMCKREVCPPAPCTYPLPPRPGECCPRCTTDMQPKVHFKNAELIDQLEVLGEKEIVFLVYAPIVFLPVTLNLVTRLISLVKHLFRSKLCAVLFVWVMECTMKQVVTLVM